MTHDGIGFDYKNPLPQLIDELAYYREMGLTVEGIWLGKSFYMSVLGLDLVLYSPGPRGTFAYLLGVPVHCLASGNPWTLRFTFKQETG